MCTHNLHYSLPQGASRASFPSSCTRVNAWQCHLCLHRHPPSAQCSAARAAVTQPHHWASTWQDFCEFSSIHPPWTWMRRLPRQLCALPSMRPTPLCAPPTHLTPVPVTTTACKTQIQVKEHACTQCGCRSATFRSQLVAGDRDVVLAVLKWVLAQAPAMLAKRAYVGHHLSIPDVSTYMYGCVRLSSSCHHKCINCLEMFAASLSLMPPTLPPPPCGGPHEELVQHTNTAVQSCHNGVKHTTLHCC